MTEFTKAEQKVLDKSGPFEAIKLIQPSTIITTEF